MENTNIFEGAKFGDKFLMRNSILAIFTKTFYDECNKVIIEYDGGIQEFTLDNNGRRYTSKENEFDVVSKWEESVDEDKLLYKAAAAQANYMPIEKGCNSDFHASCRASFGDGYIEGYRAAKSE